MGKGAKIAANLAILILVAGFIWYAAASLGRNEATYPVDRIADEGAFVSPYELVNTYEVPGSINRFDLYGEDLFVSVGEALLILSQDGEEEHFFPVKPGLRDIKVADDEIYLLYPTFIEVYAFDGDQERRWDACSELSDYCSMAIGGGFVFVTDAENKNICKYTAEGGFVEFIGSPMGFIVPNYSFDAVYRDDTLYCVNPGRHLVEKYTLDGEFVSAFGGPGGEEGFFAGCSNPAHIALLSDGGIITSEKGNPRVSLYEAGGKLGEVLLNARMLGGGSDAYEVRAAGDTLFVAGKNSISVYRHL